MAEIEKTLSATVSVSKLYDLESASDLLLEAPMADGVWRATPRSVHELTV